MLIIRYIHQHTPKDFSRPSLASLKLRFRPLNLTMVRQLTTPGIWNIQTSFIFPSNFPQFCQDQIRLSIGLDRGMIRTPIELGDVWVKLQLIRYRSSILLVFRLKKFWCKRKRPMAMEVPEIIRFGSSDGGKGWRDSFSKGINFLQTKAVSLLIAQMYAFCHARGTLYWW